jgi:HD-GYP domain-containing protein (c-di-GMP phosphodiesterase class II)
MSLPNINTAKDSAFEDELLKLAAFIDEFEGYLRPHASRIAKIADEIAQVFNMAAHDRQSLRHAALMHDLGEAVMNREYIKRSNSLSEEERIDLMRHPVIGEQEVAKRGLSRAAQLLVRWHQEWWNGEGYPDGLRREQIPLAARILRVVDTYTALTDKRPYSPSIPASDARRYLTQWAGLEFDPRVVHVFLQLPEMDELKSAADDGGGQSLTRRVIYGDSLLFSD